MHQKKAGYSIPKDDPARCCYTRYITNLLPHQLFNDSAHFLDVCLQTSYPALTFNYPVLYKVWDSSHWCCGSHWALAKGVMPSPSWKDHRRWGFHSSSGKTLLETGNWHWKMTPPHHLYKPSHLVTEVGPRGFCFSAPTTKLFLGHHVAS